MKKVSQTKKVAFGGMIAALSLVIMLASAVFPMAEYTCPAIAGILLSILVIEFGKKTALVAYVAIAILSLIIVPNKESAMLFCAFLGYYPIVKSVLEKPNLFKKKSKENYIEAFLPEKKSTRVIEWTLKIVLFNIAIIICYLIIMYVFGIKDIFAFETTNSTSLTNILLKYSTLIMLVLGNIVFVLYDVALTGLISAYCNKEKLRSRFNRFGSQRRK